MQGKRKDQYEFSMKMVGGAILCIIGLFILTIIGNSIIRGDKLDPNDPRPPGPGYNYWHPGWDENNPRTIIPEGEGTITYGDTLTDSIRWR